MWRCWTSPEPPTEPRPKPQGLPAGLEKVLPLFTDAQQDLVTKLCSSELRQTHLFEHWPCGGEVDISPTFKRRFVEQLEALDKAYPSGGLAGYITTARDLLEKSSKGLNPLEGWKPVVPTGEAFELGTPEYTDTEAIGIKELGSVGFVLVAGGLGERLGYSDIKVGLPTELATETTYLQHYIEYILAVQKKYAPEDRKLPLCIMTSADTHAGTEKLLKQHKYFGMDESQITLVQQGMGVPALLDNDAKLALDPDDLYKIITKPHGHGEIHTLLHDNKVAEKWKENGIEWVTFFQDTNALAFHTLPLMIGVSIKYNLIMNSLTVPRKAKQEIGAIAKLINLETEETRTINVEYNQLDPLLRATGYDNGDVNDETTGFSPFPGNINQLLFKLEPYAEILEQTKGVMKEFVNPKYKNADRTVFKKPTRLECLMQDFPIAFEGEDTERVGFTTVSADLCFSPVKNATADGVALQASGTHPGVAASGEADQYAAFRKILLTLGCQIEEAKPVTYNGITVTLGPQIIFKPDFACCPGEYKELFPYPDKIKISSNSSLVVKGSGVVFESLELDGALSINCQEGGVGLIRDLWIKNQGWEIVPEESSGKEVIAMRGYSLKKIETSDIVFKKNAGCAIM